MLLSVRRWRLGPASAFSSEGPVLTSCGCMVSSCSAAASGSMLGNIRVLVRWPRTGHVRLSVLELG